MYLLSVEYSMDLHKSSHSDRAISTANLIAEQVFSMCPEE